MRHIVIVFFLFVVTVAPAQNDAFIYLEDSLQKDLGCNKISEEKLPGHLAVAIAQHLLFSDLGVWTSENTAVPPAPIQMHHTYTKAFEEFSAPLQYTGMATLFPQRETTSNSTRKLVAFIDFESGEGSFELQIQDFQSVQGHREAILIWKRLPSSVCQGMRFSFVPEPAVKVSEKGLSITLLADHKPDSLSITLLSPSGETIATKEVQHPTRSFDVPFKGLHRRSYVIVLREAGNTIFMRYVPLPTL